MKLLNIFCSSCLLAANAFSSAIFECLDKCGSEYQDELETLLTWNLDPQETAGGGCMRIARQT